MILIGGWFHGKPYERLSKEDVETEMPLEPEDDLGFWPFWLPFGTFWHFLPKFRCYLVTHIMFRFIILIGRWFHDKPYERPLKEDVEAKIPLEPEDNLDF